MCATTSEGWQTSGHSGRWWCECCSNDSVAINCPYGKPGDVLWVRETWASDDGRSFWYRADGETYNAGLPWKPSIHMPRLATRITLEIESVRVERLQDISEEDAKAEGLFAQEGDGGAPGPGYKWRGIGYHGAGYGDFGKTFHTPHWDGSPGCSCNVRGPSPAQCAFRELWDSINAKRGYGWESNPWAWVLQFKVHKMNVDEFLKQASITGHP